MLDKKYEKVEIITADTFDEIVELFAEDVLTNGDKSISILASYYDIKHVLDRFIEEGVDLELRYVDFSMAEFHVPFIMSCYDYCIYIEELNLINYGQLFGKVYITMDGDIKQEIINEAIKRCDEVVLYSDERDEIEENGFKTKQRQTVPILNKETIEEKKDEKAVKVKSLEEDDEIHGFTASYSKDGSSVSYSYYSTDKLTESDIQSMIQESMFRGLF